MRDSLLSTSLRLFPPLAWLVAFGMSVWMGIRVFAFTTAGTLVLLALAAFCLRMAHKDYREAQRDAKRPPLPPIPRAPPLTAPTRYPLAEPLRAQLWQTIETFESAGALQPGEVSRDELVDCAETVDDFQEMSVVHVANILQALRELRGLPFDNLAFFPDQTERVEDDALEIVREFARLSGQSDRLRAVRLTALGGPRIVMACGGEFPPPNAAAEFELDGHRQVVPFVMYSKNMPGGLIEGLARVFMRSGDGRRFFEAGFDNFACVTYLLPERMRALNSASDAHPTWTEVR